MEGVSLHQFYFLNVIGVAIYPLGTLKSVSPALSSLRNNSLNVLQPAEPPLEYPT